MSQDSIAERVRTVYGKDLHDDFFSVRVRIDSDKIEHGDHLHVIVDRLEEVSGRESESCDNQD